MSHLLGPIGCIYVFRIGDGKEGKGEEGEAHMVIFDHEQNAGNFFNVSVFKRQIFVSL